MSPPNTSRIPERWTINVRAGSIREGRVIAGRIRGSIEDRPAEVEVVEADAYDKLVAAARDVLTDHDARPKEFGDPASAPMERLRYRLERRA